LATPYVDFDLDADFDLDFVNARVRDGTIAKYNFKLNPEMYVFRAEAGKFLGFLLTERGIEASPNKCVAIIGMRSLVSVKEVQQL